MHPTKFFAANKKLAVCGLAFFSVASATILFSPPAQARYEEPKYVVISQEHNFEVRQYSPALYARVEVPQVGRDGASEAFKILGSYIFGHNKIAAKSGDGASERIPMTVPVMIEDTVHRLVKTVPESELKADDKHLKMRFYLPPKYTSDNVPVPLDKRISIDSIGARRYAVIRYSGLCQGPNLDEHVEKLRQYVREHKLEPDGEPLVAYYNPPWTLPFFRRNEVWIPITK